MRLPALRSRVAIFCLSLLALAITSGCNVTLTDPRDRPIIRGPKAPLPDDPEGKRLAYTPPKAKTKLGRFFQKTWKKVPDAHWEFDPFGCAEEESNKPCIMPPPADPR